MIMLPNHNRRMHGGEREPPSTGVWKFFRLKYKFNRLTSSTKVSKLAENIISYTTKTHTVIHFM